MKVTAQEEYGLRCLLQLARNAGSSDPLTVGAIAESEGISAAYAEKILRVLTCARLAESIRGMRGGYRMARSPEQVTVGDVMRALGGHLAPVELCARFTGNASLCVHTEDCGLRPVWMAVAHQIERLLDAIPLSSLLGPEASVGVHIETTLGSSRPRAHESNGGGDRL